MFEQELLPFWRGNSKAIRVVSDKFTQLFKNFTRPPVAAVVPNINSGPRMKKMKLSSSFVLSKWEASLFWRKFWQRLIWTFSLEMMMMTNNDTYPVTREIRRYWQLCNFSLHSQEEKKGFHLKKTYFSKRIPTKHFQKHFSQKFLRQKNAQTKETLVEPDLSTNQHQSAFNSQNKNKFVLA